MQFSTSYKIKFSKLALNSNHKPQTLIRLKLKRISGKKATGLCKYYFFVRSQHRWALMVGSFIWFQCNKYCLASLALALGCRHSLPSHVRRATWTGPLWSHYRETPQIHYHPITQIEEEENVPLIKAPLHTWLVSYCAFMMVIIIENERL